MRSDAPYLLRAIALLTVAVPLLSACSVTAIVNSYKGNNEVRNLCKIDGGIKVYETAQIPPGEFPTIIPDKGIPSWEPVRGVIYKKYRYTESYEYSQPTSLNIYRHKTTISRIEDDKVMGELVYYVRSGEPELPGVHCPENVSSEKLVNAVFVIPREQADIYPTCPSGNTEKLELTLKSPAILVKQDVKININKQPNNGDWHRGDNCDGRTKIDRWYEKYGDNTRYEIKLTGTRLQFFGADGKRCQALAIPDARNISCDDSGVFVLGYKNKPEGASLIVQQFSKTGQLVRETEARGIAPYAGAMVSYRESEDSIRINTAIFNHSDIARCYSATALKSLSGGKRIGPSNKTFGYQECDLD